MIQLCRRTVALALAALLVFSVIATTSLVLTLSGRAEASHQFSDVENSDWHHQYVTWLVDNGLASGIPGTTRFEPDRGITRAENSKLLANYNNSLELVSSSDTDPVTTTIAHGTSCAPGKRPIAGGGQTNATNLHLTDSYPQFGGWVVRFEYTGTVTPVTGDCCIEPDLWVPRRGLLRWLIGSATARLRR